MGVARILRKANSPSRIVALEPTTSAAISTGVGGTHHVEGIGLEYISPLLDRAFYDEARAIDESQTRQMTRCLAKE